MSDSYRYPDLRNTLLEWFRTVSPTIRGYFTRLWSGEVPANDQNIWAYDVMEKPFKSSAWVNVVLATQTHDELQTQIEQGPASAFGQDHITARDIGQTFIDAANERFRSGKPLQIEVDLDWFDSTYRPIEDYFGSQSMSYVVFMPFIGLTFESGGLQLDETASFFRLSDEQLAEQIRHNFNFTVPDHTGVVPEELRFTLRKAFSLPKVRSVDHSKITTAFSWFGEWRTAGTRALSAVLKNTSDARGWLLERTGWVPSRSKAAETPPLIYRRFDRSVTRVRTSDESAILFAWERFSDKGYRARNNELLIAADRIRQADGETNSGERLIDVLTAAEAILSRGESISEDLAYRIALRAARFVDNPTGPSAKNIFETFRAGFKIRNKLLHNLKVKAADFAPHKSLDDFVSVLETLTRMALHKGMRSERRTSEEWKKLVLNGT